MGWTFSSGTGRGWTSAGRGRKARKSTDPKIWQKCVKCYWRICITVWCFDQGKHYILWLLNGLSANQIITSCTKDQMNSFSFISFSSPFLAQMCGHNLCNLQSALPRCAPRVLSISAGRGGARLAFRGAGRGSPFFRGAGRGGAGRASLILTIWSQKPSPWPFTHPHQARGTIIIMWGPILHSMCKWDTELTFYVSGCSPWGLSISWCVELKLEKPWRFFELLMKTLWLWLEKLPKTKGLESIWN